MLLLRPFSNRHMDFATNTLHMLHIAFVPQDGAWHISLLYFSFLCTGDRSLFISALRDITALHFMRLKSQQDDQQGCIQHEIATKVPFPTSPWPVTVTAFSHVTCHFSVCLSVCKQCTCNISHSSNIELFSSSFSFSL